MDELKMHSESLEELINYLKHRTEDLDKSPSSTFPSISITPNEAKMLVDAWGEWEKENKLKK